MNADRACKNYLSLARATGYPTWRTVYMLGLMSATAVNIGTFVSFVGEDGHGADWPDPRLIESEHHRFDRRLTD
jgi:hypothetical protein